MIKSMTGFGRCEVSVGERKFTVEMKSVNHRYLDVNIRMPKKLNFFEASIRNLLKEYIEYQDSGVGNMIKKDKKKVSQIEEYQKKMDNLIELVEEGGDSAKRVHKRIEELQQKINDCNAKQNAEYQVR